MSDDIKSVIADIRTGIDGDDSELRQSLQLYGWLLEMPALIDEHGVYLTGNRRLRIATELGIAPVTQEVRCGEGSAADARRMMLALVSNLGAKPLTAAGRRRIAQHLYGKGTWTMDAIAKALNTTHKTISKDLSGFVPEVQTPRPKGGRPRKPKAPPIVPPDDEKRIAAMVLDEGKSAAEASAETGWSNTVVRRVVAAEAGRREVRAEPVVDREQLSLSAQQKLDAAMRQHQRQLDQSFEAIVRGKVDAEIERLVMHYYREKLEQYQLVIDAHKGLMPRRVYRLILSCLHPDSRKSVSDAKLGEAMNAFQAREVTLCQKEEGQARGAVPWPSSRAELDELKRKASQRRRATRTANGVANR